MTAEDFWPEDIGNVNITAPVMILRDQAALLGRRTRNIVEATVGNYGDEFETPQEPFNYSFYIVARPVNNYHYGLFHISHGFDLYPVTFHIGEELFRELGFQGENNGITVNNEEYFKEILAKILRSKKTRHVIQAILAQVERKKPNDEIW